MKKKSRDRRVANRKYKSNPPIRIHYATTPPYHRENEIWTAKGKRSDIELIMKDLFTTGQAMTLTTSDGIKRIEPFSPEFEDVNNKKKQP